MEIQAAAEASFSLPERDKPAGQSSLNLGRISSYGAPLLSVSNQHD
jgi:hypothetical protein